MRSLLLVLGALMALPTAAADAAGVHLTFEGTESGCPSGKTMCFRVVEGDLSALQPGMSAEVVFRNVGNVRHMWMVTTADNMDPKHVETEHHMSMAQIEKVEAGQQGNASFTVPATARGLYFWCAEPGHEQLGMWTQVLFAKGYAPVPAGLALLGVLGAVAALARRR